MSHCAAREEAALEDEVRKRAEEIRATEEAAARAAAADTSLSPTPRSRRSTDPADSTTTPTLPPTNGRLQSSRRGPRR